MTTADALQVALRKLQMNGIVVSEVTIDEAAYGRIEAELAALKRFPTDGPINMELVGVKIKRPNNPQRK